MTGNGIWRCGAPGEGGTGSAVIGGMNTVDDSDERGIPDRAKEYFASDLPTSELTPADVPAVNASLDPIISFAYTLNGYWVAGSFRRCAEIAEALDWDSVEELRIATFFDLLVAHHVGDEFGGAVLRRLVGRVGELVGMGAAELDKQVFLVHMYECRWTTALPDTDTHLLTFR